jgi:serine/threonine-protein kinase
VADARSTDDDGSHAMTAAADRHLLFGLLALQNGLIDQGALVAAFQTWIRDKTRSLADQLVAQGDLDADACAGLEAIVALHVRRHGDVEKSLSAVPADHSTGVRLAALGEPEIDATLARVSPTSNGHATEVVEDPYRTSTLSVGAATSDGQRFRLLRPHARGGLGEVFVALDAELHREVAVKQIIDRHADDPVSRQRFVAEAEITGGLEHPGVVPVYGLGTYGGGRPYYAMRFIKGDCLKEAIDHFHRDDRLKHDPGGRALESRRLLHRFLDVCNAVDYAHSRGVIHRDLKPANIILGRHGETLVVDWGLAKAIGRVNPSGGEQTITPSSSGSSETLPGSALGTPAYMSPEQARGELDRLGPRSDVYSLGATLYCLLTGVPPFSGDPMDVIPRVQRGDFRPPRDLDPAIDRALQAVCLKAMALQSEDRYGSCRALADDIERWMADDPVSALADRWSQRVARWSRRHRSATRAAAASLVAITTVATLAALAIGREQSQTRDALKAEQKARQSERKARELAQEQSQLALDAIREYNTGVSREFLLQQPGMENLRKSLLQAPIRFYRRLARNIEDNGITDPNARARLGQAQIDLGEMINEIGMIEDAIVNFEQARDNMEQVVREAPGVSEHRFMLARTRCFLANRYDKAGRPEEARKAFEQTLSDYEQLARAYPKDRDIRAKQAEALQLRADFLWDHGDLGGSRRDYLASVALGGALLIEFPDDLEIMDKHAASLNNLSILFGEAGEKEDRMRTLAESTVLRQKLLAIAPADHPRRELFLSNLGSCYGNLGSDHLEAGDLNEAITWTREALAIQDTQIKKFPNSVEYLERVGINHLVLGQLEFRTGHLTTARSELKQARAHLEHLNHVRPGDATYRMHLARCLGSLADVESESAEPALAANLARLAVSEAEEILRSNPKYHPAADGIAWHLLRGAEISWDIGKSDAALANLDRAEAILRQLVASQPELPSYRSDLATTIRAHVRMDSEIGRDHGAEVRLREATSLAESVLRDDPDRVLNLASTAALYSDLGALLGPRKEAEGQSLFSRARELLERASKRSPNDEEIRRTMVQALASHAEFLARLGRLQESLEALDVIRRTGPTPAVRQARRLFRTLAKHEFDPLREDRTFKLVMMDLAFPAEPFSNDNGAHR